MLISGCKKGKVKIDKFKAQHMFIDESVDDVKSRLRSEGYGLAEAGGQWLSVEILMARGLIYDTNVPLEGRVDVYIRLFKSGRSIDKGTICLKPQVINCLPGEQMRSIYYLQLLVTKQMKKSSFRASN